MAWCRPTWVKLCCWTGPSAGSCSCASISSKSRTGSSEKSTTRRASRSSGSQETLKTSASSCRVRTLAELQSHATHAERAWGSKNVPSLVVEVKQECEQSMMRKFGKLVNMDAMMTIGGNRRLEELKQEKHMRETQQCKEIKQSSVCFFCASCEWVSVWVTRFVSNL